MKVIVSRCGPVVGLVGVWLACGLLAACGGDDAAGGDGGSGLDAGGGGDDAASRCGADEECDDGLFCNGAERCVPGSAGADARGCIAGEEPCTGTCDEDADSCVGACETPDADGDGHDAEACGGDDCDDDDGNRYPGNVEVCDADDHDEDCNAATFGSLDADADGFVDDTCCNVDDSGSSSCGDDCDDGADSVHPGATEACNAVDDDCDMLVDDITDGTVVCASGDSEACTTTCGVDGTRSCGIACLAWDTCVAAEVCNGCDDDDDGATDEDFDCSQGASDSCTVPVCGTSGTRTCSDTCAWGGCTAASETCNYCDDDGDGNFWEEKTEATVDVTDDFTGCSGGDYAMYGPGTLCDTADTVAGFDVWATLIDGSAVPQAGALWLTPADWALGWGPIEMVVDLEVRAVAPGGDTEQPLGGWAIVFGHGGTVGVGTARDMGVPATLDGVAARWHWSTYGSCPGGSPPSNGDGFRAAELSGGSISPIIPSGGDTCASADGIEGGAQDFDGPSSGTVHERMRLRYAPDDPTTSGVDEEELVITASTPGTGSALTRTYVPSDAIPVGSQPLRIGITAGTFTDTGFTGPPAGWVFGVPVEAKVRVMIQEDNCCGPPTITYPMSIDRTNLCP